MLPTTFCFFATVLLPNIASQKSAASSAKLKLSSSSHCDQIAMLRAFQGWQRAKRDGKEKLHCAKNFISVGKFTLCTDYNIHCGHRQKWNCKETESFLSFLVEFRKKEWMIQSFT